MIAFQEGAAGWMWIVKENFLRGIHNQHEVFSRVIQITFDIVTIYSSGRTMTAFIVKTCGEMNVQNNSNCTKFDVGFYHSQFCLWSILCSTKTLRIVFTTTKTGGRNRFPLRLLVATDGLEATEAGRGRGRGAGNLHRWPTCTATMLAPWALGGRLSIVM